MKTIKSIFEEHIYLNRKDISKLGWKTVYLTDTPITEYVIYRDWGESIRFLYLYSGMSLEISQDFMKVFFNFQSSRYEEIINMKPETTLDEFIKLMSQVSRMLSRKICNDDPYELLEYIKKLCEIGTEEFRDTYSEFLQLEFKPWRLRNLTIEKDI
jgi:hypothetical protein